MDPTIEIAIIDNDKMLLGATSDLWLGQRGAPIRVTVTAGTVAEFLANPVENRPAIVLLDILLRDGTHVANNVAPLVESGHVVIAISSENHDGRIVQASQAGAYTYVHKAADPTELVEAILAAASGESFTTRDEAAALANSGGLIELSPREREAVELYVDGMSAAEIARHMHVAEGTVKTTYLRRIKEKFERTGRTVSSRDQLRTELVRDGHLSE